MGILTNPVYTRKSSMEPPKSRKADCRWASKYHRRPRSQIIPAGYSKKRQFVFPNELWKQGTKDGPGGDGKITIPRPVPIRTVMESLQQIVVLNQSYFIGRKRSACPQYKTHNEMPIMESILQDCHLRISGI